ncbi:hypothetical protein ACQPXT_01210 [Streptomyces sp. CA-100214]
MSEQVPRLRTSVFGEVQDLRARRKSCRARAGSPAAGQVACVAAGRVGELAARLRRRVFFDRCAERYPCRALRNAGAAEERSWRRVGRRCFAALERAGLKDLQVYLEYANDRAAGGVWTGCCGLRARWRARAWWVELKQWQELPCSWMRSG